LFKKKTASFVQRGVLRRVQNDLRSVSTETAVEAEGAEAGRAIILDLNIRRFYFISFSNCRF
jgi:hypothetical protein